MKKPVKQLPPTSTTEALENVVTAMCLAQQDNSLSLCPALIGPTGGGKTAAVHRIAARLGLPPYILALGSALPEDIGGIPRDIKHKGYYEFKPMEELYRCIEEPHLFFLEEYDKTSKDTLGVTLTLLWEKKWRNKHLHPQTVIVVAMQPVNPSIWLADETGKAISARLVFLPNPYNWGYIENKFSLPLPHLRKRVESNAIHLPTLEATPRTVDCVVSFLRSPHAMKLTKEEKRMVLYGAMSGDDANVLEATMQQSLAWVDPVVTARVDALATVEALDVHTLTHHIGPLMEVLTPEAWTEALTKVWTKGTEDDAKAALENIFTTLQERCAGSPEQRCEVFGEATSDQIVEATNKAAKAIAKAWTEAQEKVTTASQKK